MAFVNNVMIIRRDLLTRMAAEYKEGRLLDDINRLPIEITRKQNGNERCCINKARAVVKYKIMAILGYGREDEKDELDTLSYYAGKVINHEYKSSKYLTVVDEACTSCVKSSYIVTNLCKGCIAQPCMSNCPKSAINRGPTGQAVIDPDKCVGCGICKSLCPYHSIIYMPVPCEESCPVGAISKNEDGIENIDEEKCILCGKCINACPFGSIIENSDLFDVMHLLKDGRPVNALIAPSIFGQYSVRPGAIIDALKKLGFSHVFEVAEGAAITTQNESEELRHNLKAGAPFMTTSCCAAWVQAVNKHIPEMKKYVSSTFTPLAYTAKECRKLYPDDPVVFIGPCMAKRKEVRENEQINLTMTFEELACLLNGWNIPILEGEDLPLDENIQMQSRNYCLSGGVADAVIRHSGTEATSMIVNGIDSKQLKLLANMAKTGKSEACMIEVMACEGGCIAGPCSHEFPKDSKRFYLKNMTGLK